MIEIAGRRPVHLRRLGLVFAALLAAATSLALATSSAGAATPVILNTSSTDGKTNWLESFAVPARGGSLARLTVVVQHDIGRKVTGLRIDDDNNGTDNAASAGVRDVSGIAEQPNIVGGYAYTRVSYEWAINQGGNGLTCPLFGSKTLRTDKPLRIRARLDNGEETATTTSNVYWVRTGDCNSIIETDYPFLYDQTQDRTEVAPGQTVTFRFKGDDGDSLAGDQYFSSVQWRLRNIMTGATTGTTLACFGGDNVENTLPITFNQRGHWVVEAIAGSSDSTGSCKTNYSTSWDYLGRVDVNSDPSVELSATRPVINGTSTVTAGNVGDPADAASGGAVASIEWDLDRNPSNGADGFEEAVHAVSGSLPSGATTRVVDTTGWAPGYHQVRVRVRDNGAASGADNARGEPIRTANILVDHPPVASDVTAQTPSDEQATVELSATDEDSDPLTPSVTVQPEHGTATVGEGMTVVYDPDDSFAGVDTFTYQVDDGYGGIHSAVASVTVTPATNVDQAPNPSVVENSRAPEIRFSSPTEQGSSFEKFTCSLDFGEWYDCSSPAELSDLTDGNHNFRVRAHAAGQVDPTPSELEWQIDAYPTVELTHTPAVDSGDASPSFEFTATEAGNTEAEHPLEVSCVLDGGPRQPCASPLQLTDLADGDHSLTVFAVDRFGKESSRTFEWEVQSTGPHTIVTAAPGAYLNQGSTTIEFNSESEENGFECSLDGGAWEPCSSPVELSDLGEGQHTFKVRAVSPTAVPDPTPASRTWVVDSVAPSVEIAEQPPAHVNGPVHLVFSSDDPEASFACAIDGEDAEPCASPYTGPALADGPHTITVSAVDPAGNVSPGPAEAGWTLDTVAPTTTIGDGPSEGALLASASAELGYEADEPATFQCRVDSQTWRDCGDGSEQLNGLPDGEHTFTVRAIDAAGNADPEPASRSWSTDTKAPVVTVTDGPSGTVRSAGAELEFASNEQGSTFECRIDGGQFDACESPRSYESLADGPHAFAVRAIDPAGNVSEKAATRSWRVDTSAAPGPSEQPEPPAKPACDFKAERPDCGSVALSASLKAVGKGKRNLAVELRSTTGGVALGSNEFRFPRGLKVALAKKARGKQIGRLTLDGPGGSRSVGLVLPPSAKVGARTQTLQAGDLGVSLKKGRAARVSVAGLPEGVTAVALRLKGRGLTVTARGCRTQAFRSSATDRSGNGAAGTAYADPPCVRKKGAR